MSNEEAKPEGMPIQQGLSATAEELVAQAQALGVKVGKASNFGMRTADRSSPVPVVTEGEPILDAAAGLQARKRGEVAIVGHGIVTKAGKSLFAKVEEATLSE